MTELILACDTKKPSDLHKLINTTADHIDMIKLGLEFFTYNGPYAIKDISKKYNKDIFLDLKLHDIPNTVAKSVESLIQKCPFKILTIHASGGIPMMTAANQSLHRTCLIEEKPLSHLAAVSVLTSISQKDGKDIGIENVKEQVIKLAKLAETCGITHLVCSAYELEEIKKNNINIKTIVPGIKLEGEASGDQSRVMTPKKAKELGADYIVVGRTITSSKNPSKVAEEIKRSIL